ncbi:hypothetical protein FJW05_04870 [Mesorhizobium sp. B2-9-1]|uniref:hypothetical protein n=1 Tax=unclassified Mesorhizobium TaxID=325217 RepID=UPI00112CD0D6|nr:MULTISPECIES: hypothetical protein [unclassified Mesorhizobium]TPI48697.1 hypothetical protein FJW05_04870 [Mesorhizobium sp. B2-9-1]TPJ30977.1 hypothetical protein FJ425_04440 [Mesorhizobium sp. B2-7-2]
MARKLKSRNEQDPRMKLFPPHRKWVDMNAFTFANLVLESKDRGKLGNLMEILKQDHVTVKAETVNESKRILRDADADLSSPFARVYLRLDPKRCKKRPYSPPIGRDLSSSEADALEE